MKIRYKITLLFTVLVTLIIGLLGTGVYYFSDLERKAAYEGRLRSRVRYNAQFYALDQSNNSSFLRRLDSSSTSLAQKSILILELPSRKPYYRYDGSDAESFFPSQALVSQIEKNSEYLSVIDKRTLFAQKRTTPRGDVMVFVAAYDQEGFERLEKLKRLLVYSSLASILLTLLVGYLFSRQLVKPIQQIIGTVNEISSQNLSKRIEAGSSQDELSSLANTFNDLLGRLQEAFAAQRRFISNASHELSTPLTSISSQLEVTLQKSRSPEEYQDILQSINEDVLVMRQLTRSLLQLAKTGSQSGITLEEIRVDEILLKVVSDIKRQQPDYTVEINFGDFPEDEKSCLVFGNADLLYSALKNVVENGCKYSREECCAVSLYFERSNVVVEVRNDGELIAEEELEHIFQPFYRGATGTISKGFGLGLALARSIISLHKGQIKVESQVLEGTRFTIVFPSMGLF